MLTFFQNTVGKKILMALTGQAMIIFIILHALGNSTIIFSDINAYAETLHTIPFLLWAARFIMVTLCLLHIIIGIQLYLENRASKPDAYIVKNNLSATFGGKTMLWTGLITGIFLVFHLLHFTFQVMNPEISSKMNNDALGRPDVFKMMVLSFQRIIVSSGYFFAMIALVLHLSHGIQSSFQSLGINSERSLPVLVKTGSVLAYALFLIFVSIPFTILFGLIGE